MAVSSQAVANSFLQLARAEGRSLTNMQLQKLVFLAQGYAMALLDRPVYYHHTHAWQWGPVIPKLYKALQKYGSEPIAEDIAAPDNVDASSKEMDVIRGVWDGFKQFTGSQLSNLTHKKGTPWSQIWASSQFAIIPDELIGAYYKQQLPAAR